MAARTGKMPYEKALLECRVNYQKLLALNKEVFTLRKQIVGTNSPVHKKEQESGMTPEETKRSLAGQKQMVEVATKTFIALGKNMTDFRCLWLDEVVKAHPDSQDAKNELVNLKSGKYVLRLL